MAKKKSTLIRERDNSAVAVREAEAILSLTENQEMLRETIAELELALEDVGWYKLTFNADQEFSREGLRKIMSLARLFYLKNPIINRCVEVQALYVWGQGVNVQAEDEKVNAVIQRFLDNPKNKTELTSHQAAYLKEVDLQVEGNIFFALFPDSVSGQVLVRTIPPDEIADIICNPEDGKDPWFYKRAWTQRDVDGGVQARTAYYPDWRHTRADGGAIPTGAEVVWDTPVYHIKVGALSNMRFGLPEVYQSLDWAKAYKSFLEDWATIIRAYSRFALQLTTKGGKAGIAAAKAKLGTSMSGSNVTETNPPPTVASTFIGGEGTTVSPIRTAGATTSAEEGRRILLMALMGCGIPETLAADVSVGTLATAKSLDRPTELKFKNRQTQWADILGEILDFVIDCDLRATGGMLPKPRGVGKIMGIDQETGQEISRRVMIDFPPILEHDIDTAITAIVRAATLDGKPRAGTMDDKTLIRLLLQTLGVQDIDEIIEQLVPPEGETAPKEAFTEALRELRAALAVALKESKGGGEN